MGSSSGQTAIHVASAEQIWVDLWTKADEPVHLSAYFKGSRTELLAIWQNASKRSTDLIGHFPESDLELPVTFIYPDGRKGRLRFYQSFAHIVNHSTYHRGQLVTLLRQAGFDTFSSIDLATYDILHQAS